MQCFVSVCAVCCCVSDTFLANRLGNNSVHLQIKFCTTFKSWLVVRSTSSTNIQQMRCIAFPSSLTTATTNNQCFLPDIILHPSLTQPLLFLLLLITFFFLFIFFFNFGQVLAHKERQEGVIVFGQTFPHACRKLQILKSVVQCVKIILNVFIIKKNLRS